MTATSPARGSRGAAFRAASGQRIEAPVAAIFVRTHLTPNMLTLIGFGIAIIGAYLAAIQLWIPAGLVVGFGAAFDLFDGALARATGKSSKLGAFMDSTSTARARQSSTSAWSSACCALAISTAPPLLPRRWPRHSWSATRAPNRRASASARARAWPTSASRRARCAP